MTILVLVESPGKVKKIQGYLGDDYEVFASVGHIRSLPHDDLGFDIQNNYKPEFIIMPDKEDVVKKMRNKAANAAKIILCSDADLEGHAISWHCAEVCDIPVKQRYRATFTEITKKAIVQAINAPAEIPMNSVYAQFARMILDKLIGYKISPLLWKEFNNYHLSAGRVQSIVVKIISEREAEIAGFTSNLYYKLTADFVIDKSDLTTKNKNKVINTVCTEDITDREKIETLYKTAKDIPWIIKSLSKTMSKRNPPPPFITSTLQQEASARLGMSPEVCMKTAQKLYEAGLITYMRTDAVFIAEDAMKSIKEYVVKKWGNEYYRRIDYKTKNASSQEAHECCRPVDISKETITLKDGLTNQHSRLYGLIWRRTMASQMAPMDIETKTIKITGGGFIFVGKHEKIIFQGFQICNNQNQFKSATDAELGSVDDANDEAELGSDNEEDAAAVINGENAYLEKIFGQLKEGMPALVKGLNAAQKATKPPHARYTEASLIKKLDDLGIGRPSTYASMIKKVQEDKRQYVEKKSIPPRKIMLNYLDYTYPDTVNTYEKETRIAGDKNKLFPTGLGNMIGEYLDKNFADIINYEFTATVEALLDEIATGSKIWYNVVNTVYIKLNPIIDQLAKAITTRKKNTIAAIASSSNVTINDSTPNDTANRRFLGNNPESNMPVYAIKSRRGFLLCEEHPEKDRCRFANFTSDFANMTLNKALKLLIYPRILGQYKDKDIVIKKAKSVYIAYDGVNYSIDTYIKNNSMTNKTNKTSRAKVNTDASASDIDIENLSLEDAIMIIEYYMQLKTESLEKAKENIVLNDDITLMNGIYGPYIKYQNTVNISLPAKMKANWQTITLEQCLEIIAKKKSKLLKSSAVNDTNLGADLEHDADVALNTADSKTKTKTKPKRSAAKSAPKSANSEVKDKAKSKVKAETVKSDTKPKRVYKPRKPKTTE